jgi:hypothetical protein
MTEKKTKKREEESSLFDVDNRDDKHRSMSLLVLLLYFDWNYSLFKSKCGGNLSNLFFGDKTHTFSKKANTHPAIILCIK